MAEPTNNARFGASKANITIIVLVAQVMIVGWYVNRRVTNPQPQTVESLYNIYEAVQPIVRSINLTENCSRESLNHTLTYSEILENRTKCMRLYCAKHKTQLTQSYPRYERSIYGLSTYVWMVSPHHQLFYCATPKCASTTWKTYIMEDLNMTWKGDNHVAATKIGIQTLFQRRKPDVMKYFESYRPKNRLAIVRNPWARLVSAYENKIVHSAWPLEKLCVAAKRYTQKPTTFARFVDCIVHSSRDSVWNAHIQPFTSLCAFCHMDYNMIVKMEEMDQATEYLFKALHFTKVKLRYKPRHKGIYTNTYASHYSNIPEEHIHLLQDIYKNDIRLFDYPTTPFI